MSKSLEEIQAEMSAQAATTPPAPEPSAALSIPELLKQLSAATNIPMEKMLGALDAAAPDQPELLPEGAKVYYTSFPNSGVHLQVGPSAVERFEFRGDRMVVTDPAAIAALDAIADKPGSTIYTKSNIQVSAEVVQMRADLRADAARAQTRMVAAGERVS